jgi:hypothetical protein
VAAQAALPQAGSSDQTISSPVAFVYVASARGRDNNKIYAFAAALDGKLTPVSGSPFVGDVTSSMTANGKYIFGTNGVSIYSFSMASDGALKKIAEINAQQFNEYDCGGPVALFVDRTGTTLYDEDYDGNECANTDYQFFNIDDTTGQVSYAGATGASSVWFNVPVSFTGNNAYAYGSASYDYKPVVFGFKRTNEGKLTYMKVNPPMPAAQKGDFYDPYGAAADSSDHVAISVVPFNGSTGQQAGPPQLATYTADGSGHLSTTSTYSNMPKAAVKNVTDLWMSPSGKLLAVGGTAGLEVFHFNGSNPITHYTGLLSTNQIDQFFWDNSNHLYAISRSAGKLFVFNITPTSFSQAPGSPYLITNPQSMIVVPEK